MNSVLAPAPRTVRVEDLMGTSVSIHAIGERASDPAVAAAVAAAFAGLREIEDVFSPFRSDSDVSRIRRGELAIADADPRVGDVARACREAERATGGRFSARWRGGFDPTGYVKGWAVDEVAREALRPLIARDGVTAVGINAGGDVLLMTADDADWTWSIGIVDPVERSRVLAVVDVRNGAVATSGTGERGAHLIDPRSGRRVDGLIGATVVAEDLATADVWATAAAVAGVDDLSWISSAPTGSGLVSDGAGATRRWLGGIEVGTQPVSADRSISSAAL